MVITAVAPDSLQATRTRQEWATERTNGMPSTEDDEGMVGGTNNEYFKGKPQMRFIRMTTRRTRKLTDKESVWQADRHTPAI